MLKLHFVVLRIGYKENMGKHKRDKAGEPTTSLVGVFMTPTEKKLIEDAKPDGQSMSEFCREILLPKAKLILNKRVEVEQDG